jgi:carboxymethylenebutenolidase
MIADFVGIADKPADVSRRGFMTASAAAAAGYTLLAGPVSAQAVMTDTNGLTAGMVQVRTKDGQMMPAYRAKPSNVQNPPVVLVAMEIFGVHEYIKDVCRRWAKQGALAIAPDYYFRAGDLTKITDNQQLFPIVNAKRDDELMADLDATVAWAKSDGGDTGKLGVTGFCRGGRTAWMYAAHNRAVDAGVAFYGTLEGQSSAAMPKHPIDVAKDVKAPVLGLYGGADTGIPLASVDKMKKALDEAKKKYEFKIYPEVPHAFHADYRPTYRKEAAEDAWRMAVSWFRQHGVLPRRSA